MTRRASVAVREAAEIAELDPSGAYVLAYDAAGKSVAGTHLTLGHRVLRHPGSHQALAQYAAALAMQVDEPALDRFDRLRPNRNLAEYGSRTFGKAEVKEAIDTAGAIRAACASLTETSTDSGLREAVRTGFPEGVSQSGQVWTVSPT